MDPSGSEFIRFAATGTFLVVLLILVVALYFTKLVKSDWKSDRATYRNGERRRSKRFRVSHRIFVYGHESDAEPFSEEATVLQVSADGALLILATSVRLGQQLLLAANDGEDLHQRCWVARLGRSDGLRTETAIRFARAAPQFWLAQINQNSAKSAEGHLLPHATMVGK
jgi:hypothetical protein